MDHQHASIDQHGNVRAGPGAIAPRLAGPVADRAEQLSGQLRQSAFGPLLTDLLRGIFNQDEQRTEAASVLADVATVLRQTAEALDRANREIERLSQQQAVEQAEAVVRDITGGTKGGKA